MPVHIKVMKQTLEEVLCVQQQRGNGIFKAYNGLQILFASEHQSRKFSSNVSKNRRKAVLWQGSCDHSSTQARKKYPTLGPGCRRCGLRAGKDRAVGSHLATHHLLALALLCSALLHSCCYTLPLPLLCPLALPYAYKCSPWAL